ncbi:MAG TPA: pyrroline-5-carboxylate reductase [Deltaproteobacteria bacterium]|nr:pyrroline-5-carboxylate reductase [Deltaproteobacteria bacterium]HQB38042.1 pyrroline-5-carboxylate reductase [Deltaproteobacteria bacterium]
MLSNHTIAFIGGGNMAEAILKGLLSTGVNAVTIHISEPMAARREHLAEKYGVTVHAANTDAVQHADIVILAIKPQVAESVIKGLAPAIDNKKLVITIMAGIRTDMIEAGLAPASRVVRVMPNTPALVGAGATAICAGANASTDDVNLVDQIFALAGDTVRVEEKLMDAVTALSGSGPAFVCAFIEALSDAGVKCGLSRDISASLAVQTVLGTARMVHETGGHPALLREQVTSPAGTTIAGLHALEVGAFRGTVMNAVDAACQRSKELGS